MPLSHFQLAFQYRGTPGLLWLLCRNPEILIGWRFIKGIPFCRGSLSLCCRPDEKWGESSRASPPKSR